MRAGRPRPPATSAGFDREGDEAAAALALDPDEHIAVAILSRARDELRHVLGVRHRRAADRDEEIAGAQPLVRGGAVLRHLDDDGTLRAGGQRELRAQIRRQFGELHAQHLDRGRRFRLFRIGRRRRRPVRIERDDLELDLALLAVAPDRQFDLLVGWRVGDKAGQLPAALDRLAVVAQDEVARLQFRLFRRARPINGCDHRAAVFLEAETLGDLVGDRLNAGADPAALDFAGRLQLLDDRLRHRRWDRKADADRAARGRIDRRVDADDLAGEVEHRPAGIAAVYRGVGLQIIVIRPGMDVAHRRRDDAGSDGAAEPERVADRQYPIADPGLR